MPAGLRLSSPPGYPVERGLRPFVPEQAQPVLAGRHDIQPPGAAEVRGREADPAPLARSNGPVGDHLLAERLSRPLVVVDAEVVPFARLVAVVGPVPLARHELARAVTVYVHPLQVVELGVERVDGMADPGARSTLVLLLPPVQAVRVALPHDELAPPVAVDVLHKHRDA